MKLQVVIPGYCVAGTVGHKVLSGQKKIELDKKSVVSYETFAKFTPIIIIIISIFPTINHCLGEQGLRIGESACLPPMCPGFDSRTRRLYVG